MNQSNLVKIPKLFTPYKDRLAIQVIREDESAGGVAMPQNVKMTSQYDAVQARVIAVGPECRQAKEGDLILVCPDMDKKQWLEWRYMGHIYRVIHESFIFGVVDEAAVAGIPEPSKLIVPEG